MKKHEIAVLTLFVVTVLILAPAMTGGQSDDIGAELVRTRVPKFAVRNGNILDGVAQLSASPTEISFSFEDVLKPTFKVPPLERPRFDVNLENRTISEILDAICHKDGRYTWSRDGLTINVYPQATIGDNRYLMNRRVPRFELKGVKSPGEAVFALVGQLPAPFEQIACAQLGGDTSYPTPWNVSAREVTVRQALNMIARQLGPRGGWVFNGSRDFRTIGFHNRQIHYSSRPGR